MKFNLLLSSANARTTSAAALQEIYMWQIENIITQLMPNINFSGLPIQQKVLVSHIGKDLSERP